MHTNIKTVKQSYGAGLALGFYGSWEQVNTIVNALYNLGATDSKVHWLNDADAQAFAYVLVFDSEGQENDEHTSALQKVEKAIAESVVIEWNARLNRGLRSWRRLRAKAQEKAARFVGAITDEVFLPRDAALHEYLSNIDTSVSANVARVFEDFLDLAGKAND